MGIAANWEESDSYNPAMAVFTNAADLSLPDFGKVECIPVLPNTDVVNIPPEAWENRIAYIAVQLERSLQKAKLLGFVRLVPEGGKLVIAALQPLDQPLEIFQCRSQHHG